MRNSHCCTSFSSPLSTMMRTYSFVVSFLLSILSLDLLAHEFYTIICTIQIHVLYFYYYRYILTSDNHVKTWHTISFLRSSSGPSAVKRLPQQRRAVPLAQQMVKHVALDAIARGRPQRGHDLIGIQQQRQDAAGGGQEALQHQALAQQALAAPRLAPHDHGTPLESSRLAHL